MKNHIYAPILLISLLFWGCDSPPEKAVLEGKWIGKIAMQGKEMPFEMLIETKSDSVVEAVIINGEERIVLDEISKTTDSIHITMNVFDISLNLAIKNNTLTGYYIKHYLPGYQLPITFLKGDNRFLMEESDEQPASFSGTWEVTFVDTTAQDTTRAVGIFEQNGKKVTGTFLTPLGDYRYLDGVAEDNQLKLSTFDGNHAFLFEAFMQEDGTLSGDFYSGKDWHESWTAVPNKDAKLPDPDSLTYLKRGYDRVYFEFPDLDGELVKFPNADYENKVVILQIFGTWCPNCMDETKFLTDWYDKNKERGVEIIGLAYETKDDFAYAKARVEKMINKWDVGYKFLIAGHDDKEAAAKTLPMLNQVIAFPTMIIIDNDGEVHKIHTGFSGPGTGKYYDEFVKEFNTTLDKLLDKK